MSYQLYVFKESNMNFTFTCAPASVYRAARALAEAVSGGRGSNMLQLLLLLLLAQRTGPARRRGAAG